MEVSKAQKNLSSAVCTYNALAQKLELSGDYKISTANLNECLSYWQTTLLNNLRLLKKNAKREAYDAQNQKRQKDEEINHVSFYCSFWCEWKFHLLIMLTTFQESTEV